MSRYSDRQDGVEKEQWDVAFAWAKGLENRVVVIKWAMDIWAIRMHIVTVDKDNGLVVLYLNGEEKLADLLGLYDEFACRIIADLGEPFK